ncbi:MAG: septum formation initiator family protein [Evtepia sp.]|uniref:FtsB family cell division protein n=1 Tax=Evtepia sp. TaxID=2773933 RepID=UPI002A7552D2|nr:septum formation initiator family protein [Evtepia sp.]MDY3014877.1 septum formation initiator family protein [Evtepia sp.]
MIHSKKVGLLVRIGILALLAYSIFMLISVRQEINQKKSEIASLNEQVADQTQTNTELSNAIENRDDPSFIREIAREKLGLVAPNDKVFYITD